MKKLVIVIPLHNEEESLNTLNSSILSAIKKTSDTIVSIIYVNDGSTDFSLKILKEIKELNTNKLDTTIVTYNRRRGKTEAMRLGMLYVKNVDFVCFMDADLQDDPIYIKDFLDTISKKEFDLVVGNRVDRYKKAVIKRSSSKFANFIARILVRYDIHDLNCGYKIMTLEVAKNLDLKSDYHRYIPMIAALQGYRVGEIKISQRERKYGISKYGITGLGRTIKSLLDLLSTYLFHKFSKNPFDLFGKLGLLFSITGFLILAYLTINWFLGTYILGRPLFFLGILLLTVGVNFICLGFLAEMIGTREPYVEHDVFSNKK